MKLEQARAQIEEMARQAFGAAAIGQVVVGRDHVYIFTPKGDKTLLHVTRSTRALADQAFSCLDAVAAAAKQDSEAPAAQRAKTPEPSRTEEVATLRTLPEDDT